MSVIARPHKPREGEMGPRQMPERAPDVKQAEPRPAEPKIAPVKEKKVDAQREKTAVVEKEATTHRHGSRLNDFHNENAGTVDGIKLAGAIAVIGGGVWFFSTTIPQWITMLGPEGRVTAIAAWTVTLIVDAVWTIGMARWMGYGSR